MDQGQWASLEPGQILVERFSGSRWRVVSKEPAAAGVKRTHFKLRRISPEFRISGEPVAYDVFEEEPES